MNYFIYLCSFVTYVTTQVINNHKLFRLEENQVPRLLFYLRVMDHYDNYENKIRNFQKLSRNLKSDLPDKFPGRRRKRSVDTVNQGQLTISLSEPAIKSTILPHLLSASSVSGSITQPNLRDINSVNPAAGNDTAGLPASHRFPENSPHYEVRANPLRDFIRYEIKRSQQPGASSIVCATCSRGRPWNTWM